MNVRLDASSSFRSVSVWRYTCLAVMTVWGFLLLVVVYDFALIAPRFLITIAVGLVATACEIARLVSAVHCAFRQYSPEYHIFRSLLEMPEPYVLDELTRHPYFGPWYVADTVQLAARRGYVQLQPQRGGQLVTLTEVGRREAQRVVSR